MTAGLWGVASALSIATVTDAIPPACRRRIDAAQDSARRCGRDEAVIETPAWPAAGASHFVPSFTALTDAEYSVRLELSARVDGGWSPWVAGVGLGPSTFAPLPPSDALGVDVDVFGARLPVEAVRARARIRAPGPATVLAAPGLLTPHRRPVRARPPAPRGSTCRR